MATKNESKAATPPVQETKKTVSASTYTVEEFMAVPNSVGVSSPDLIKAAFKIAGKEKATVEEAKKIVEKFKNKEVK